MATILSQPASPRPATGAYKVDISRGQRIGRVSSEWFSRPDDERFLSRTFPAVGFYLGNVRFQAVRLSPLMTEIGALC